MAVCWCGLACVRWRSVKVACVCGAWSGCWDQHGAAPRVRCCVVGLGWRLSGLNDWLWLL